MPLIRIVFKTHTFTPYELPPGHWHNQTHFANYYHSITSERLFYFGAPGGKLMCYDFPNGWIEYTGDENDWQSKDCQQAIELSITSKKGVLH